VVYPSYVYGYPGAADTGKDAILIVRVMTLMSIPLRVLCWPGLMSE
jgi:hypothetical protein